MVEWNIPALLLGGQTALSIVVIAILSARFSAFFTGMPRYGIRLIEAVTGGVSGRHE